MSVYNFSPGPSKLHQDVIDKVEASIQKYDNTGKSILEISHRSNEFDELLENIKLNLTTLFNLPKNFDVLLIQGGATFQNTLLPMNIDKNKKIGVLVNGTWGKKTYEDFKKLNPNTDLFEVSKNNLGEYLEKNNFENLDYLHITSNETIEGIQIKDFNEVAHSNLLVDMSSDLGSYPFSFDKVSYIYAGAQKNMGIPGVTICLVNKDFLIDVDNSSYLNLKKLTTSNSVLNTPPTFSIFVLNLVTEWMIKSGGLDYFEKKSISQSNELYKFLDENSNLFDFSSELRFRSKSNVVFKFKEDKYNDTFIKQANDSGIIGINGHRSIGGIRVSLFNSVDQPMFNYFMDFLKKYINESL
jgi:phosphoserine aminotransferase|tara:strand:+ start:102 stop:1166 length:1065 start_codon:yes stop_codon:yes gene_type:complete